MTLSSSRAVSAGDTFKMRKPDDHNPHLWVVVTDPDDDGDVAIVNLTSRKQHSDDTVTLNRGDHTFIERETVIYYQDARRTKASALTNAVRGGAATVHDPCRLDILTKIQRGLDRSPYTPNDIKEYVRRQLS